MKLITGEFTKRYLQSCSRNIYSDDDVDEQIEKDPFFGLYKHIKVTQLEKK